MSLKQKGVLSKSSSRSLISNKKSPTKHKSLNAIDNK